MAKISRLIVFSIMSACLCFAPVHALESLPFLFQKHEHESNNDYQKLIAAMKSDSLDAVKKIIESGSLNADTHEDGITPLMLAAQYANMATVKWLVENGANVNQGSRYEWTPLMFAANVGRLDVAAYLIERGAKVNLVTKRAYPKSWFATTGGLSPSSPIEQAIKSRNIELVKLILSSGLNEETRQQQHEKMIEYVTKTQKFKELSKHTAARVEYYYQLISLFQADKWQDKVTPVPMLGPMPTSPSNQQKKRVSSPKEEVRKKPIAESPLDDFKITKTFNSNDFGVRIQQQGTDFFSMSIDTPLSYQKYQALTPKHLDASYTNVAGSVLVLLFTSKKAKDINSTVQRESLTYPQYPILKEQRLTPNTHIQYRSLSPMSGLNSFRIVLFKQLSQNTLLKVSLDRTHLKYMPQHLVKKTNRLLANALEQTLINGEPISESVNDVLRSYRNKTVMLLGVDTCLRLF